jgi:pimeloyl-ACP methyl ester carboxylesterase
MVQTAAVRALQRLVLFPRFALRAEPDAGAGVPGLERMWHDSTEGRVEAWFLPGDGVSAAAPGPAVVFAHGNGELIEHWPELLSPYRRMGVSVLLPEYRGYGRSAGAPSEEAIREDFLAFYARLVARPDVDPRRVVLHGRSLGGGAVCALAERHAPAALILMSTFTSVADVARAWLVPGSLITDRFDSLPIVRRLDCPILVVHGRRDRVVPFAHGRTLAEASRRGRLVPFDADHNDCPPDWAPFWREVAAFLGEAGVL